MKAIFLIHLLFIFMISCTGGQFVQDTWDMPIGKNIEAETKPMPVFSSQPINSVSVLPEVVS